MALRPPETLAQLRAWPGDADVAVALTFDVDAESAWLGEGPAYERRLTTLSQAGYGPVRGLGRILDLLDAQEIKSTFYVPGHTADHFTPETLAFLGEMGFSYDSSLMRDDRPYWENSGGQPLLELPVHWSLDDWPFFGYTAYHGGLLADPQAVERIWLEEFAAARADGRLVTYTMHPEVIGRGYCLRMLERIILAMRDHGQPWFATHAEIAALAQPAQPR